jgi:class 3 adenylate cyclase/tetratricopeptide (TPR) repeat protein
MHEPLGQPVTILFTDVQGSTQLRARRGDRVADGILHDHEAIVRRAIGAHGGVEVAFLGDGFMATFGAPAAGLRCAIAIQQELQQHGRDNADRRIRVRIGLHHGDAVRRDGALHGQAVNAASRVMSEAAGGQILVTAAVRDAIEATGAFSFVDRGLYWLRGFPDRWRLYEAEWGRDGAGGPVGPVQAPFVGRERERADLRRAVGDARVGRGSFVLVSGEAGVGKSRLVHEIDAEADARGLRVLAGHSVKDEGQAPYLPFTEMLEQGMVTPRSPAILRDALGDAAPEIARIAPALRLVVPDIPAPLELPPEQARRYLWLSVREFIGRAAQERPLLLVFEDLHWADQSTLLLLEYLAPQLPGMPVMIVGTFRDDEVEPTSPLARILNQLVRERLVTRVTLRPLTREDVGALLAGLAGQRPPAAVVRGIHAQSEGNPFFAEELYFHLAESGALLDDQGRFRGDLRVEDLDIPSSVRMVVGERLARLSEATQRALVAAAVRGRVFELDLVERVAGEPGGDLLDAFDEAERARLIAPSKSEPSSYTFGHELIRQTLLADASTVRRRRLHAAIAAALEAIHADDLEAHAADLAYHLAQGGAGGRDGRLVRYLRMAGDRAMDTAAYAEAADHFARAVSLLEHKPDAQEQDRAALAELVERLAMALRSQGRWDEALKVMDEALRLYEALGRTDALGRLCGVMSYQLGWAAKWEEAVTVASRGLAALGDLPNPDRARLLAAAAWVSGLAGDYAGATGMFAAARELAGRLGDDAALADVLQLQTIHHLAWAELADGVTAGLRAAEFYEATHDLWELTGVLAFVEYQHNTLARPGPTAAHADRLTGLAERVAPMAERLGHLGAEFLVVASRIRIEGVYRADLAVIERMGRHVVEICERAGLPWLYVGHLYLGLAADWRGDWETAERVLRLADQLEAPGAIGGQSAAHLALHLARAGRGDEAVEIVEARRPAFPVAGRTNSVGAWNMLLGFVEALALAGRPDEVAALRPLLDEALALDEWISFDGRLVSTRAAIAAAAARDWDAAERHLATALATAEALGNRIEQVDLGYWRARMLLDRDRPGDREAAAALAAEAAGRYRALGLREHAEVAAALAGSRGRDA